MDKQLLAQYADMKKEIKETEERVEHLTHDISRLTEQIKKIERNETVVDCVKGGEGGIQTFKIEGVPIPELRKKKNELLHKKLLLNERISICELLKDDLDEKTVDVERFISEIEDSRTRRIVQFRVIDGLSWEEVASRIDGKSTSASVKMAYKRFIS